MKHNLDKLIDEGNAAVYSNARYGLTASDIYALRDRFLALEEQEGTTNAIIDLILTTSHIGFALGTRYMSGKKA